MQRRQLLQLALPAAASLGGKAVRAGDYVRLAVIVAAQSPVVELELGVLRRLFGGDPWTDSSGRALVPFNHPPRTPDRIGFDQRVLGMSSEQVAKYWVDRKIRAQPGPPRTVSSLRMLIGVVSKLPGAIGYLRPEYLTNEVKVVRIGGKLPDAAGYPLVFGE